MSGPGSRPGGGSTPASDEESPALAEMQDAMRAFLHGGLHLPTKHFAAGDRHRLLCSPAEGSRQASPESFEQSKVGAWIEQGQMFRLPVDIHQQGSQFLQ